MDTPTKRCTKCGVTKPVTDFYRNRRSKDGICPWCKACYAEKGHQWYVANREKVKERTHQWRVDNPEKYQQANHDYLHANKAAIRERAHQRRINNIEKYRQRNHEYYHANKEEISKRELQRRNAHREAIRESDRQRRATNPERYRQRQRSYYAANREHLRAKEKARRAVNRNAILEQQRQRRATNPERYRQRQRSYYAANRERIAQRQRQYRAANPETIRKIEFDHSQRRRTQKCRLLYDFTPADWQRASDYFGGCCAICGRPPDPQRILAADHWIPLSDPRPDNPGTVPTNIVPMCHGIEGCNTQKSKSDPVEWLIRKLGEEKAIEKLAEIEAYFEWVRSQR